VAPTRKIDNPLKATKPGGNAEVFVVAPRDALLVDGFETVSGAFTERICFFWSFIFLWGRERREILDAVVKYLLQLGKGWHSQKRSSIWLRKQKKDKRVLLHKYSLFLLLLSFYLLCCCERKSETTEKKGARASD
jgi:hypothetical protein